MRNSLTFSIALLMSLILPAENSFGKTPATQPTTAPASQPGRGRLGIIIQDLNTPSQAKMVEAMGGNLVVQGIIKNSRADRIGFKAGDVILRINGEDMKTVPDIIRKSGEEMEQIDILRNKQPMALTELLEPA